MKRTEDKLPTGEIVVENRAVAWLANLWYHYKWTIIVVLFFGIVLTVGLVQCAQKESTDVSVGYAGNYVMDKEQQDILRRALSGTLPKDYNEDGNRTAALYTYSIFSDEEMKKNATAADGILDSYTYQAAKKTNQEEISGLRTFLQTGECSVWIMGEYAYRESYINVQHFARPVAEVASLPEGMAYDAYAVRLCDTALYRQYTALQFLPEDTLVVLLHPLQWGASGDDATYQRAVESFCAIVGVSPIG